MAYVRGLRLARICSQEGINDKGANAVLENRVGRLIMKIRAKNSMCPGKIKPKQILRLAILSVISTIMSKIMSKFETYIICLVLIILNIIILKVCTTVTVVIKYIDEKSKQSREVIGDTNMRFRNPNSLSNIIGKPALIAPLKEVNTIMPGLKNTLYFRFVTKNPIGAFWKRDPNNINHSKGCIIPAISKAGLLFACMYKRLINTWISFCLYKWFVF